MDSYTAVVDGVSFDLTQREFEVLRELLLNQGRVLTRQNLLDKLWRYDFYGDERVVDTHIKNLLIVQKKLIKKRSAFQRGHGLQLNFLVFLMEE